MTEGQKAALRVLDESPAGQDLLRRLADPQDPLRNFIAQAKKETFVFLTDVRPGEIAHLASAIQLVDALQRVGRAVKWCIYAMVGAFLLMASAGEKLEKVLAWIKPR